MRVKEENYIQIQGWMRTKLNLNGNELLLFALIYGFSQDGESKFTGSLKYMCDWIGCTKPTARKFLESLVQKNLIDKGTNIVNDVQFNFYSISLGGVKKFDGGGKEILPGGGKEILPNNNRINNNKKSIVERQAAFADNVRTLKFPLPELEIDSFISHWTEKNPKGKKMRFELQKVFDIEKRLRTWERNAKKWNRDVSQVEIYKYKSHEYSELGKHRLRIVAAKLYELYSTNITTPEQAKELKEKIWGRLMCVEPNDEATRSAYQKLYNYCESKRATGQALINIDKLLIDI